MDPSNDVVDDCDIQLDGRKCEEKRYLRNTNTKSMEGRGKEECLLQE